MAPSCHATRRLQRRRAALGPGPTVAGPGLPDRVVAAAVELAQVDLAQARVDLQRHLERVRDHGGGLERLQQRAADHQGDPRAAQGFGGGTGLGTTQRRQRMREPAVGDHPRDVRLALAVPHEVHDARPDHATPERLARERGPQRLPQHHPLVSGRVVGELTVAAVAAALVEAGHLETKAVEVRADGASLLRDPLGVAQQARADARATLGLGDPEPVDAHPRPGDAPLDAADEAVATPRDEHERLRTRPWIGHMAMPPELHTRRRAPCAAARTRARWARTRSASACG